MRIVTKIESAAKKLSMRDLQIVQLVAGLFADEKGQVIELDMDSISIFRRDKAAVTHEISGTRDELRPIRRAVYWLSQFSPAYVTEEVIKSHGYKETRTNLPNSGNLPRDIESVLKACARQGHSALVSACFAHAYGLDAEGVQAATETENTHSFIAHLAAMNRGNLPTVQH